MTSIEVLEQLRPKHYSIWSKEIPLFVHIKSTCDACLFDKAISDLIQEAMISGMNQEREECVKIVKTQIEGVIHHWMTTDIRLNLEEVAHRIAARAICDSNINEKHL